MSDDDWIFASVINFLQSPLWNTPVMTYIDQNCLVFDSEEENKFAYTDIHKNFKDLVEDLLDKHVIKEVGITVEQFLEACEKGINAESEFAKLLFDKVLASDDFVAFKKMMFQRNKELETEAIAALHNKDRPLVNGEGVDEDEDYKLAVQLSSMSFEKQRKKAQQQEDDELTKAIENSMKDQDSLNSILKKENEDLEKAIGASTTAEEERKQRKLKGEEKQRIVEEEKRKFEAAKLRVLQDKGKKSNDEEFRQTILLSKKRQEDLDRQSAAQTALDRLFAKQISVKEEQTTASMSEDSKKQRQQQISSEMEKLVKQSVELRKEALEDYLK